MDETTEQDLMKFGSLLNLNDEALKEARRIYQKIINQELYRSKGTTSMLAGALYIASKEVKTPRTMKEISNAMDVDKNNIGTSYRLIIKNTDLEMYPSDPRHFIPRYAGRLDLSTDTQIRAKEILDMAVETNIPAGKNPVSLCGGALFIASKENDEKVNPRKIGKVLNISDATIRDRYQEFKEEFDEFQE